MTAPRSAPRSAASSLSSQSAHAPALDRDGECDSDQQIIDACMAGDGVLLDVSRSSVAAQMLASRADELRISAAFIRKCRLSGAHPGMRSCLNCDSRFLSAGSHNRLCRSCGRA